MSLDMNRKDRLWKYKQEIINKEKDVVRLPYDYQTLKMSLKAKIYHLKQKLKAEKNQVKRLAIKDVITIYERILGE